MNAREIAEGAEIHVPAGADMYRSRPYYVRIVEVYSADSGGYVFARAEKIRSDGTSSRRRARDGGPVTVAAFLDPQQCTRRSAP